MPRKSTLIELKRKARRQRLSAHRLGAGERLEPRAMLAVTPLQFLPDQKDPWGLDVDGRRNTPNETTPGSIQNIIDALPRDISLPAGSQVPTQSWALPNGNFLTLFGSSAGTGTFRAYSGDGTALSWPTVFDGYVRDVSQTPDGGFFVWGNVDSLAQTAWIAGGFDTTYNGGLDGYVAKLRPDGSLDWATLVGAQGDDTVESVTQSADGTIFIVGNTSSSGGFVNGTADQVWDDPKFGEAGTIAYGRDTTGAFLTKTPTGAANSFAGTEDFTNGYVMVISDNGKQHIWSSYLSPIDPRNVARSGAFTAYQATFVTDTDAIPSNGQNLARVGIVVNSVSGGAKQTSIVTLTERAAGTFKDPLTGARSRDFEFTSISPASVPDVFFSSVRTRPPGTPTGNRSYYYMTAADPLETDTVAYNPLTETRGTLGSPSTRSLGRVQFTIDTTGNVTAVTDFNKQFSSFSLTGYFPTDDAIYVTGTTLSTRNLGMGPQFSGYHTYPTPVANDDVARVGNYGDVVVAELGVDGAAIRSQIVGNYDSANPTVPPAFGLKEKGGGIVVFPGVAGGTLKLVGSTYAQPGPGQGRTNPTGGKLWTYAVNKRLGTTAATVSSASTPPTTAAPAAIPATSSLQTAAASAASPLPLVQWTGYVGSATDDTVSDAWMIPKTTANRLTDDQVVIQQNGGRQGYNSTGLAGTNWSDGINGQIAQIQLNADATKLYAVGSTTTPGWTQNGFDTTISQYTEFDLLGSRTFFSSDGFLARVDVNGGRQDYSTYLGGNGETYTRGVQPAGRFQGNDFATAFYIDPTVGADAGRAYVVGRTQARSGLGTNDGVTDQPKQTNPWGSWPTSSFDSIKSQANDARVYDGMVYSLYDQPEGSAWRGVPSQETDRTINPAAIVDQLNWASYVTPRIPTTPGSNDDNEPQTNPYLLMQNADFVWVAKNKDGGNGRLVYIFGDDQSVIDGTVGKAVYVFNEATVNNAALPMTQRIRKYSFLYDKPDQIVTVTDAMRADGTTGPSVYFRTATRITRIDLPKDATLNNPLEGLRTIWSLPFTQNELKPAHMAVNGDKLYVASTVRGYSWANMPEPLSTAAGGKLRNGPSDAALLQVNAINGTVDWWTIQGGDGAEQGQAVAAFPDGRVWLLGDTSSLPTITNSYGWVAQQGVGTPTQLGNRSLAPSGKQTFVGGLTDGFIVQFQTNAVASKSEIDVGGVVGGSFVAIADGAAVPSLAQGTDFGKSVVNGTGTERIFRIRNTGTEALALDSSILPSFLELKSGTAFPTTVAPGSSADVTFVVKTGTVGTFTGVITFQSNDADEGSYDFAVRAEVITPPPSTFSIAAAAATITEGNSGTKLATFTVTLAPGTPAPTGPLSVAYAAVGTTATAGSDFTATSGTLTFALGETSKTVSVPIIGDLVREFDETFRVQLSSPSSGAVVSTDAGSAGMTILTDDGLPEPLRIGVSPASVRITEGNSGTKQAVVTVSLNQAWATAVSVNFATANGSAVAGSDYTATSGRLTIAAGATQGTIQIPIRGDTASEADETFTVRLSNATAGATILADTATVTIVNDDGAPPLPAIRVANATVIEGNSGSPKLTFTITLAQAYSQNITLAVNTVDGTARAGRDYTAFSGTVTILAGRTSATVAVNVLPNTVVDGNRTLSLQVRNGSTLVATGVGTIQDDDTRRASPGPLASPLTTAAFASLAAQPQTTSSKSSRR